MTSAEIKASRPGTVIRDDVVTGLHLRAFDNRKSFYLWFRTKAGQERKPKLGDFGVLTVAQARDMARAILAEVAAGRDPVAERRAVREAPTVADLCDRYLGEHAKTKKSGTKDEAWISQYVLPRLGRKKIADVAYDDAAGLHKSMAHVPYLANRVQALLSKMFNLAERWGYRPAHSNPCRHVARYKEAKRERYMARGEAQAVAEALARHEERHPQAVAFLYLLILTGARCGEIAMARWDWLDGNVLRLPDSKTGAKPVFLPPQALAVVEKLPRTSGTICGIKSPRALWDKVRHEAGCPDLRLHDLRHSFASAALAAGLSLSQIGELLGHRSTQTTKRYAHLMDEAAHAAAAQTASKLAEMMGRGATCPQEESSSEASSSRPSPRTSRSSS